MTIYGRSKKLSRKVGIQAIKRRTDMLIDSLHAQPRREISENDRREYAGRKQKASALSGKTVITPEGFERKVESVDAKGNATVTIGRRKVKYSANVLTVKK